MHQTICRRHQLTSVAALWFILILCFPDQAFAQPRLLPDVPALPGEQCRTMPRKEWTRPEKWAWKQICEGRLVDFDSRYDERFDPNDPRFDPNNASVDTSRWTGRALGRTFLVTVLAYEPYRSAVPPYGVQMRGAYFRDGVDLADADINRPVLLHASRFDRVVNLSRLSTPRRVAFQDSTFAAELHMDSAHIGGDLTMNGSTFAAELHMDSARIGGDLTMNGSTFKRWLTMESVRIKGDLTMLEKPRFRRVVMRGAQVSGRFAIRGARFTDLLELDAASIGRDLIVRGDTVFCGVALRAAEIGDQLDMVGSEFNLPLLMNGTKVAGSVLLGRSRHRRKAVLRFVEVGRNVDVREAGLRSVDLTGARIEGELRLGSDGRDDIKWRGPKSKLILRNVRVGGVMDRDDSWPDRLELDGFEYVRFNRIDVAPGGNVDTQNDRDWWVRNAKHWFECWLRKDATYSPQPYQQLARVLRAAGHEELAYDILVANRNDELEDATWTDASWWKLWALWLSVGYGYGLRPLMAAGTWSAVLVVMGVVWLRRTGPDSLGFWFSLDMLLPVVHLNETHYTTEFPRLTDCTRYYFYVHQVCGYVLGVFVVAGLTGLTE